MHIFELLSIQGPLDDDRTDILQDLLGLERQTAEEDDVTLLHNVLVVEVYPYPELLLEGLQEMGLSR
jgi:hypothetical protein